MTELKFGELSNYYLKNLRRMDERTLRREYQRLQVIADKRIKRMEKAGFSETALLTRYGGGWEKVSAIPRGKPEALLKGLYELAWFSSNPRATVGGERAARKREIATLHKNGYDFVTLTNYDKFRKYMQVARKNGLIEAYGSDRIAEVYAELSETRSNPETYIERHRKAFERMLENEE